MSNLPAIQNLGLQLHTVNTSQLSRTEMKVLKASISGEDNLRMNEMDSFGLIRVVTRILAKASIRLGRKPSEDEEEEEAYQRELSLDLVDKFESYTEREIMLALENGLDGVYKTRPEEVVYFTHSNFVQWLRAYKPKTKEPIMAKVASMKPLTPEEAVVSDSERLKSSHQNFLSIIKRVLDGGEYEDWGNPIYSFLEKIDFLAVKKAEYDKAYEFAKRQMKLEALDTPDLSKRKTDIKRVADLIDKSDVGEYVVDIHDKAKRLLVDTKLVAFLDMPEDEQAALLESISERVEYMCIELKNPEQYSPDEE